MWSVPDASEASDFWKVQCSGCDGVVCVLFYSATMVVDECVVGVEGQARCEMMVAVSDGVGDYLSTRRR